MSTKRFYAVNKAGIKTPFNQPLADGLLFCASMGFGVMQGNQFLGGPTYCASRAFMIMAEEVTDDWLEAVIREKNPDGLAYVTDGMMQFFLAKRVNSKVRTRHKARLTKVFEIASEIKSAEEARKAIASLREDFKGDTHEFEDRFKQFVNEPDLPRPRPDKHPKGLAIADIDKK